MNSRRTDSKRFRTPVLIGIAGGIGSGKSVVSRILRLKGFEVYDCDIQARMLMTHSAPLKESLSEIVGKEVYGPDGSLNKPFLAQCIFSDHHLRQRVNSLVHEAVKQDLRKFVAGNISGCTESGRAVFVESAILAQSGLSDCCDEIWIVTASEKVCIERVASRSGLTEEEIIKRIEAQKGEKENLENCGKPVVVIENDNDRSLLMQIEKLI